MRPVCHGNRWLNNNQLSGSIAPELGDLTRLQYLFVLLFQCQYTSTH
jgi:hypothetical protein